MIPIAKSFTGGFIGRGNQTCPCVHYLSPAIYDFLVYLRTLPARSPALHAAPLLHSQDSEPKEISFLEVVTNNEVIQYHVERGLFYSGWLEIQHLSTLIGIWQWLQLQFPSNISFSGIHLLSVLCMLRLELSQMTSPWQQLSLFQLCLIFGSSRYFNLPKSGALPCELSETL